MAGILCSTVSRGTTILAKFTGHAGNFDEFVDNVLAKIAPGDQVKWSKVVKVKL